MEYINKRLQKYYLKSQKYTGIVDSIDDKTITIKDILANGSTGIVLKTQKFNIGAGLLPYIKSEQVDKNNIVEFYASVSYKTTENSELYFLNRMRQIEVLGTFYE